MCASKFAVSLSQTRKMIVFSEEFHWNIGLQVKSVLVVTLSNSICLKTAPFLPHFFHYAFKVPLSLIFAPV